jgi:hypothetical protein
MAKRAFEKIMAGPADTMSYAEGDESRDRIANPIDAGWHRKYWDTMDQIYWSPNMIGLRAIAKSTWGDDPGKIVINRDQVKQGGSIYTRRHTASENRERMAGLEEPLNHIFDITFGIAECAVIARMFFQPFGIDDHGPFLRIGREIGQRYADLGGNLTQQDALFVSHRSIIGVELKLGSSTSPGQILKYLALIVAEERLTGVRRDIGLLYITPEEGIGKVAYDAGLTADGRLPEGYVRTVPAKQRNALVNRMLEDRFGEFEDAAKRVRIQHKSWKDIASEARVIGQEGLSSPSGSETLARLMFGFSRAIEEHRGAIIA